MTKKKKKPQPQRNQFTPKIFGVYQCKKSKLKKVLHRGSWSKSEAVRRWWQSQISEKQR